jgi:hypothetical protein
MFPVGRLSMNGRIMWKWTLSKKRCTGANGDWIHLAESGHMGSMFWTCSVHLSMLFIDRFVSCYYVTDASSFQSHNPRDVLLTFFCTAGIMINSPYLMLVFNSETPSQDNDCHYHFFFGGGWVLHWSLKANVMVILQIKPYFLPWTSCYTIWYCTVLFTDGMDN